MSRVLINIKGVVQGVGFRPFVYNLARTLGLKGHVTNTSDGVDIDIEGEDISLFIERLPKEAPPLAEIRSINVSHMPFHGYEDFRILKSIDKGSFTLLSPDVSVCDDCLNEMLDKNSRRYLYPFINCTNCGPRYTITNKVPYDRPNTTMSSFKMCPECGKEYSDPSNRRFHAQPNACAVCGPEVKFKIQSSKFKVDEKENPIESAIKILKQGGIVAMKGLGGFHIVCDAKNREAVERLRLRKRKSNKPFALMSSDIETIGKYCLMSEDEKVLLRSNKKPIVLLKKKAGCPEPLPDSVTPNNQYLGFMLPYTPLHYLLFYYPLSELSANFDALVMTSGNLSEEPIVIDNNEAMTRLSGIADAFLIHNRNIFMRADDSVVRFSYMGFRARPLFIRRSRGYAPEPITLNEDGIEVLGCGADMKNTFTLTKGNYAIPSHHIGDMENYETVKFFEESLENLKSVYRISPAAIAYDLHPNYFSTKWALSYSAVLKTLGIQHHYAHVASVMAEQGIKRKVIGVAFDGTGYGTDGNLWGSEFMIADINDFKRAGHFKYIALPGGEAAIREPWRTTVSYFRHVAGDEAMEYLDAIGFIEKYGRGNIENIFKIIDNRELSPLASGAGRLFDAVSSMLRICDKNTFEGEAAMALESYVRDDVDEDYPVDIVFKDMINIDFSMPILCMMNDRIKNVGLDVISSKFHNTIVTAITRVVTKLSGLHRIYDVILSGGVFQNMYLLKNTIDSLRSAGMNTFINEKVPANDAGISLGQAYIIRERMKEEGWEQEK